MSDIRIYTESSTGHTFFLGTTVSDVSATLLQCDAQPSTSDQIRIWRTDRLNSTEYLFKRLDIARLQNEAGQYLVADLAMSRADILLYLNNTVFQFVSGGGVTNIQDLTGDTGADGLPADYNYVVVDKTTGEVKTIVPHDFIEPE